MEFFILAIVWIGTCLILGKTSGWENLAKAYPVKGEFSGSRFHLKSAKMGFWGHYNGCLNFGANDQGLFISVMMLMRLGHPSVFVPWCEISAHLAKGRIRPEILLEFENAPGLIVRISKQLAEDLARASHHKFIWTQ